MSMARGTYFTALAIVAFAVGVEIVATLGRWTGMDPLPAPASAVTVLFSRPLPGMLQHALPSAVQSALLLAFAALIARRVRALLRRGGFGPPASYSKWPRRLLAIAVASLVLATSVLLLALLTASPIGALAGFLGLPGVMLLSPVLFYVEARSMIREA